ncbi:MAG: alpha/beta hydrolase fold domain-containing protein [Dehalococcoidia bacterium]|nr:alpha/beta hydrolase fold domain-containing protein [Dehalococcoidia bacterium]
MMAQAPPTHSLEPQVVREARKRGGGVSGPPVYVEQAQQRTLPCRAGDIPVRVFVPAQVRGVYLHFHGGGWVLGSADGQDPRLWDLATAAEVAVISVEYRLAPEHPYPAGPDDCEAAAAWLVEHVQSEFGTDRIAVGGESAGAHLAANTLLRMRDRHGYTGFAAANLVFGVYDLGRTPSQETSEDAVVIPRPTMEWFYDHYCPDASMRRDPDLSPMYADLTGLPPARFSVGTLDPLLDDSILMAKRWTHAGNEAELRLYPGGFHGFISWPGLKLGEQANLDTIEFIRSVMGAR